MAKMFSGLSTQGTFDNNSDDDDTIHYTCQMELERYLHDARSGACPMNNTESEFNNPLIWWKVNAVKYPYVANLAHKYLAIPATSAPSERIWSRAARILSLRRARLKDDLVGRMMLIKENSKFLHKHYSELVNQDSEQHLHHLLVELENKYLPQSMKRRMMILMLVKMTCLFNL